MFNLVSFLSFLKLHMRSDSCLDLAFLEDSRKLEKMQDIWLD